MIILYDKNHNKICGLVNYKDLNIVREINKLDTLTFLYPISDKNYNLIAEEGYIQTKDNEYVIKEINYSDENYDQVVCEVNIENIKGNPILHFETKEQKCADAVNLALAGTGWTLGSCDVTKLRTVKKSNCSSYDVLQEIQNIYHCEMTFDAINKKIYVYQSMGTDKGVYFSEQLNLKKVDTQKNTHDYITRLIPIGKNGLDITSVNNGCSYVENHQYSNKVITAYWSDNRYTVAQDLYDDAVARLDYLSKPQKNYSCDVYDLANISDKYSILNYGLGDTITLLSKSRNVKEKQRIVKLVQYPDEPEKNTCEISNKLANIEDLITRFVDTSDTVDDVTTSDNMLDGSKIDNFDTDNIQHVHIKMADIDSLSATIANIGTLIATKATITNLDAANARIDNLTANKASITDLSATNGRIKTLEGESASINTLLVKGLTASNMQAGFITADCGLIAKDAISDAMIKDLSVSKVLAGDISTNKFRIVSNSGNMLISDNTIQIKDSSRVRVQIGKDASSDYNMYVWDASGNLMFDAAGLKASGIKDKIIRDDMVSDTANINGSKIEKESLITQINGATTLLKASKVHLDTENQTLDVAFTSLKTSSDNTVSTVSSQGTAISAIQGQINSKIWQQDITTAIDNTKIGVRNLIINGNFSKDLNNWNYVSSMTSIDTITYLGNKVVKFVGNGTANYYNISQCVPLASLKPNTTYTLSCYAKFQGLSSGNKLFGLYTEGETSTSGYSYTTETSCNWTKFTFSFITAAQLTKIFPVGWYFTPNAVFSGTVWLTCFELVEGNKAPVDYIEAPEDTDAQITTLNSNYSSLQQTVNGISSNVGSLQTQMSTANGNITSVTNKESSLEQTVNGLSSTVTSVQQNYLTKSDASTTYATQTSVSSLSQTVSGLSSTVSSTKTEIDGLQIGGRNLLRNSAWLKDNSYWGSTVCLDTSMTLDGCNSMLINESGNTANVWHGPAYTPTIISCQEGEKYTASIYTRTDNISGIDRGSMLEIDVYDVNGARTTIAAAVFVEPSANNTWQRFSCTATIPSGCAYVGVWMYVSRNGKMWFAKPKLEQGNKATDWTSAPEDTQSQIDGATTRISSCESSISQQAGLISQKVSSTDYNGNNLVSMINQSASKISMSALNIDLSGYATFISLSTPGQTSINGANLISGTVTANTVYSSATFSNCKKDANLKDGELYLHQYDTSGNLQFDSEITTTRYGLGIYSTGRIDFIKIDNTYGNIPMGIITPTMGRTPAESYQGEFEWDGSIRTTCASTFQSIKIGIDTSGHYSIQAGSDELPFYVQGDGIVATDLNSEHYTTVTAVAFNNASSIDLKTNITELNKDYCYDLLKNNMVARKYKYKGDKRPYSVGVIAEESPMEITDRQDCKSVDIYAYATVIMAALQKAQEKIETLENEINKLKGVA